MSGRFSGKIALITGAASGIGAAFARLAVAEGAEGLALLDRDAERLQALADELERPTVLAGGDVGDVALWADFEARIGARFGRIDLALANAGIGHPMTPIAELEPEVWSRVINVNLTGAFLTLRMALRLINDDGAIVLVSSSMGVKPSPNTAGYGASKAALIHLAKIAAWKRRRAAFVSTRSLRAAWRRRCSATPISLRGSSSKSAAKGVHSIPWRRVRRSDATPARRRPPV